MSLTTLYDELSSGLEQGNFDFILKELHQTGFEKCRLKFQQNPLFYEALNQLYIRQKYRGKIKPLIERYKGWIFPHGISLQQSSHPFTAKLKSSLAVKYHTVIDLTGGLGMDSWAFANAGKKVIYVEKNSDIFRFAEYNFGKYLPNVECHNEEALTWLEKNGKSYTRALVYADPARRDTAGNKVFLFHHYQPEPKAILKRCRDLQLDLMLKLSPMADIQYVWKELDPNSKVLVLGVEQEVKELVLLYQPQTQQKYIEIWLCGEEPELLFSGTTTQKAEVPLVDSPEKYVYIPHPALCKIHADTHLAGVHHLRAFHPLAKIYTAEQAYPLKGWRVFETITGTTRLKDITVKEAMIVTGIFPQNASEIRKKHNFNESDITLLVATKSYKNKNLWILAKKIAL
ncbi:class I SAM-dependent methyltransferase [Schleiferia thermophila]|jgi:hypothetical protein|uniref:class I SAM-dependent methyltransferase n=1 Tax=Schleiferia thermophila TaxID=884107 RepID=UPI0004E7434E|nr:class I SAM-dependent methyltransferase [Schleiferia thermophila]KFD40264.1 hypothetical protein AT05_00975 [Schleiferia thermophila str. Yellowstone]